MVHGVVSRDGEPAEILSIGQISPIVRPNTTAPDDLDPIQFAMPATFVYTLPGVPGHLSTGSLLMGLTAVLTKVGSD